MSNSKHKRSNTFCAKLSIAFLLTTSALSAAFAKPQKDQTPSASPSPTELPTQSNTPAPALSVSNAPTNNWTSPSNGYTINTKTLEPIAKKSGEHAIVQGEIIVKGGHTKNGNGNSGRTIPLTDLLAADKLKVTAYFPDKTTEIPLVLNQDSTSAKATFQFVSPALSPYGLNTFTIQINHLSTNSNDLQKLQAKLQRRIHELDSLIGRPEQLNNSQIAIHELATIRAHLASLTLKISSKLSQSAEILAEVDHPIQVDNLATPPGLNSTVQGNFRFSVISTPGSVIEGMPFAVRGEITSLKGVGSNNKNYSATFSWNGELLYTSPLPSDAEQRSISYLHQVARSNPREANDFSAVLVETHPSTQKQSKDIGSLSTSIPVAVDAIPAHWVAGSSLEAQQPVSRDLLPIDLSAKDTFGALDQDTVRATLSGFTADISPIQQDIKHLLEITQDTSKQTLGLSGNLHPLTDGTYQLTFEVSDMAGNSTVPHPLQKTFTIDRTAPIVTLDLGNNSLTKQQRVAVPVKVEDYTQILCTSFLNGIAATETRSKLFTFETTLTEGLNLLKVSCVDEAGNVSIDEQPLAIRLDSISPELRSSLQDNYVTNSPIMAIPFSAGDASRVTVTVIQNNSPIYTAHGNDHDVQITLNEGLNQVTISAVDDAGNTADPIQFTTLRLDTAPPVITLKQADGQTVFEKTFIVSAQISDTLTTSTVVSINGSEVFNTSTSNFDTPIDLAIGKNQIAVRSTDEVGNVATVKLNNITYEEDNTPALLVIQRPAPNEYVPNNSLQILGRSNKRLANASVNGQMLSLSPDGLTFTGNFQNNIPGKATLHFEAEDVSGNRSSVDRVVEFPTSSLIGTETLQPQLGKAGIRVKLFSTGSDSLNVSKVLIPIESVKLYAEHSSAILLNSDRQIIDIGQSAEITRAVISSASVESGRYSRIEFRFGSEGTVVLSNGVTAPVTIDPNQLIAAIPVDLTLTDDKITDIQIHVPLNLALTTAASHWTLHPTFTLQPFVTLTPQQTILITSAYGRHADGKILGADTIAEGVVAKKVYLKKYLSPGIPGIVTSYILNVKSTIKGEKATQVSFELPGGKYGKLRMVRSHTKSLALKKGAIVFLRNTPNGFTLANGSDSLVEN